MIASRRILALSRDCGSMQAILPVIRALQTDVSLSVTVATMEVSRSLFQLQGIEAEYIDAGKFTKDSIGSIATLLDRVRPDLILSGSSPAKGPLPETPEQYVVMESRKRGIPSVAVLDFWGMYHERFVLFGNQISFELLPDILCVLDEYCRKDLLDLGVPESRMSVTHNPWLDSVVKKAASPPPPSSHIRDVKGLCVLFVSQPLAEMASVRPWSYDQNQVLTFLLDALPVVDGRTHRVLVWTHPAENQGRWRQDLSHFRPDVEVVVIEERGASVLAYVDLVASSHSTATYEGLYYGTPSISLRPSGNWLRPMHTDEIGLSLLFSEFDLLKEYLENFDSEAVRVQLYKLKKNLLAKQLFFTDGYATNRVCEVVRELLSSPPKEAIE